MTEQQKETQRILGRNNEIDRHVRTLERLYDASEERAFKCISEENRKYYLSNLNQLKKAQNELAKSIQFTEKLISLLPDKTQRDILMLYHVACIPMDEVAETIHYDRSTTWVKYKHALDNLATVLDGKEMVK